LVKGNKNPLENQGVMNDGSCKGIYLAFVGLLMLKTTSGIKSRGNKLTPHKPDGGSVGLCGVGEGRVGITGVLVGRLGMTGVGSGVEVVMIGVGSACCTTVLLGSTS